MTTQNAFLLLFHLFTVLLSNSSANEMSSDPLITCAADAIYIKAKTTTTFNGHVSIKLAPQHDCYQTLVTNNQIEVLVPHLDCALPRKRLHSPDGLVISTEVVIAFHPDFLTKDDVSFKIDCLYQHKNSSKLENGTQLTKTQEASLSLQPQCEYTIKSSQNGRPLHSAAIGDTVFHEWRCLNTGADCLLVRNCFFVAGDAKYPLIDADGCTRDRFVLDDLHYFSERLVGQNVSVFGVTQKPVVFFECELVLVEKTLRGCAAPQCPSAKNRTPREISTLEVQSQRLQVTELRRDELQNTDNNDVIDMSLVECAEAASTSSSICLSTSVFALTSALVIVMIISSVSIALGVTCTRKEYSGVNDGL